MMPLGIRSSIGSELGDSTQVFGSIADVSHDAGGNILVLDQVSQGVKVFSPEGDYITQIGRGGTGPGEMLMPMYMTGLYDGRIIVMDPMQNALVAFDSTYGYIENISCWSNGPPTEITAISDSSYAGILIEFDMERDDPMMIRNIGEYSRSRVPDVLYYSDQVPFDFSDFTGVLSSMIFSFAIAADREGRFFYSPISSTNYEIYGFDANGSPMFHIERDLPPVPKTEQEMQDEILYIEGWASRMGMQGVVIDWQPDPYRTFVRSLGTDGQGRLWAVRGTDPEPVFDVYDMTGELLFSARLPVPGRSWRFNIDTWGIVGWEEDPGSGYQELHLIDFPSET
jgi:hypothetical protein